MTPAELEAKIIQLMAAASSLEGADRAVNRIAIRNLENDIDGLSLDEIAGKLTAINLPDLEEIDRQIQAAEDSASDQARRAEAINTALGIIRTGLGLVL